MRVQFRFLGTARGRRALLSTLILAGALGVSAHLIWGGGASPTPHAAATPEGLGGAASNLDFTRAPLPNLTAEFADLSLEGLLAENEARQSEGAKNVRDFKLLPDRADVNSIISRIIDADLATERVAIEELRAGNDGSKEAQIAYLLILDQLFRAERGVPAADSLPAYFSDAAAHLNLTVELLRAMSAPPSWLDIHRDLVEFFTKQRNLLTSLASAEEDPLRFLIASTRVLPLDADTEFAAIQVKINQRMKDEKLI